MTTLGKWVIGGVIAFLGFFVVMLALSFGGSPTSSAAPMEGCIQVSPQRLEGIAAGLTLNGGSLREAWAFRSGAHQSAYFVAAEVDGPGLEGDGHDLVYFVTSLDSGGSTLAVDELAVDWSDWPDGATTGANTSTRDPGVREARDCLARAQR